LHLTSDKDFSVFEATPGKRVVFLPDIPLFTIVAVSNDMLQLLNRSRADIIGESVFKTFPANPLDSDFSGHKNLMASLELVITHKKSHQMEKQRYDVAIENGSFQEIYWQNTSTPVLNEAGEVIYIIHTAEDITEQIKSVELEKKVRGLQQAHYLFLQAPVIIGITRGDDFVLELANEAALKFWNKSSGIVGKPLLEGIPEFKGQSAFDKIAGVYQTGISYHETESEVRSLEDGKEKISYFDVYYEPYFDEGSSTVSGVFTLSTDVTEKVLAKRKIEESETKLRSILNSAPTAMGVFVGPDLVLENPNQFFIELMGAGPDIEGRSFRKLLSGLVEDGLKFLQLLDTVRTTGQTFDAQEVAVFFKADAKTRYFNISFIPLFNDNGEVYAVLDVSVDVTRQLTTRRRLLVIESRFRDTVMQAPVAIAIFRGSDHIIEVANDEHLKLWGRTADEVTGRPLFEALPELARHGYKELLTHVLETGEPYYARELYTDLRRDDRHQGLYLNFVYEALRENDGTISGVMVVATEVTEQVQARKKIELAEERLRLAVQSAGLGTYEIDMVNDAITTSERFLQIWGATKPLSRVEFAGAIHPDDLEIRALALKQAEERGDLSYEARVLGQNGVLRWVKVTGKYIYDGDRNPLTLIGVVQDITEQKEFAQELAKQVKEKTHDLEVTNKELQRSNANLEEFAHAASHDLKEPIRKIHFFTHQLKNQLADRLEPDEVHSLGRIENSTQRMGNLIEDLLQYSHVSQRPHETEAVDLNVKLQRVLEDLELDIAEKQASIRVGNLPVIQGYRRQLQQLFQNLISNALKYSKAGLRPEIEISASLSTLDDRLYNVISVRDNGIGFEKQYSEKIFQMFSRLHGKEAYSGTGVGLSIAKKVVENHSGFIRVESEPEKGSRFDVYLPR
jgi:PAS domain S-box-containing protein